VVLLFDQALSGRALRDELAGMLPVVPLASLLVEVDARTGFTDHLVHAGGQVTRSAELKRHLLYVIIAEAANMGLGEMAASAEISDEALAWTAEWYFRPETLEAASGKKQQNALTSAMKEYGTLRRTIYAALMWNQPLSSPAGQRLASESASSAISSASTAVRHVISAVVPTCGRGLSNNGTASGVSLDSREVG
jgi:hypothetical protein